MNDTDLVKQSIETDETDIGSLHAADAKLAGDGISMQTTFAGAIRNAKQAISKTTAIANHDIIIVNGYVAVRTKLRTASLLAGAQVWGPEARLPRCRVSDMRPGHMSSWAP